MRSALRRSIVFIMALLFVGTVFLVPFIPDAFASTSFVQGGSNHNLTSTSIGCPLSSTVTAGDTIFFMPYSSTAVNVDSWSDGLSSAAQGYSTNSITLNSALYSVTSPAFSVLTRSGPGFFEGVGGASDTITTPISGGSSASNAIVCAEFTGGLAPAVNLAAMTNQIGTGTTTTATVALSGAGATPTAAANLVIINLLIVGCNGIASYTLPTGFLTAAAEVAQTTGITLGCASGWSTQAILAYSTTYAGGASTFSVSVVSNTAPTISETYNSISVSAFVLTSVFTTITNTITSTITSTITNTVTVTATITNTVTSTITNTITSTITNTVTSTITNTVTSTITDNFTSTVTSTTTITTGGGTACSFTTNYTVCFAAAPPGSGTTSPSAPQIVSGGTMINIIATPTSGWVFVDWTSSSVGITFPGGANNTDSTILVNHSGIVTANFAFIGPIGNATNIVIFAFLNSIILLLIFLSLKGGSSWYFGVFGFIGAVIGVYTYTSAAATIGFYTYQTNLQPLQPLVLVPGFLTLVSLLVAVYVIYKSR